MLLDLWETKNSNQANTKPRKRQFENSREVLWPFYLPSPLPVSRVVMALKWWTFKTMTALKQQQPKCSVWDPEPWFWRGGRDPTLKLLCVPVLKQSGDYLEEGHKIFISVLPNLEQARKASVIIARWKNKTQMIGTKDYDWNTIDHVRFRSRSWGRFFGILGHSKLPMYIEKLRNLPLYSRKDAFSENTRGETKLLP